MQVLVSNDDGVEAPGIQVLAERLAEFGTVTIVAPDRDRSGSSNSLTLDAPIRAHRIDAHTYRVAGTPTDCVHLGISGLLDHEIDIVVSGINNVCNLGDDVIYSGTVSAAMEGRFLGLPAIAVSLVTTEDSGRHFASAASAVLILMRRLVVDPLPADTILNVNVPDLPWDQIRGFEVTRLGKRHRSAPTIRTLDPHGKPMWWIGPPGKVEDDGTGTDFDAVRRGYVSVTPIHTDLTRFQALEKVSSWMDSLSSAMDNEEAA
jgi:5'-nucleotidase